MSHRVDERPVDRRRRQRASTAARLTRQRLVRRLRKARGAPMGVHLLRGAGEILQQLDAFMRAERQAGHELCMVPEPIKPLGYMTNAAMPRDVHTVIASRIHTEDAIPEFEHNLNGWTHLKIPVDVPPARWANLDGSAHVIGGCCRDRACHKCGAPEHRQGIYGGMLYACETCDAELFSHTEPVPPEMR